MECKNLEKYKHEGLSEAVVCVPEYEYIFCCLCYTPALNQMYGSVGHQPWDAQTWIEKSVTTSMLSCHLETMMKTRNKRNVFTKVERTCTVNQNSVCPRGPAILSATSIIVTNIVIILAFKFSMHVAVDMHRLQEHRISDRNFPISFRKKYMGMHHCQQHRHYCRCCRQNDLETSESQTATTAISTSYRHFLCNSLRNMAIKSLNNRYCNSKYAPHKTKRRK